MSPDAAAPRLIVLMGVAGTGKTTLGRLLAARMHYGFLDADDFHDAASIERMRSGIPLTDTMREAWMERLCSALLRKSDEGLDVVLAFSGLRARHRRRLLQLPFATRAFMLRAGTSLLNQRLLQRQDHFMPASRLEHQLAVMEPLAADEKIELIDLDGLARTPGAKLDHLMERLGP